MPLVSKTFSQIITFTRASTATYFDATGTLQSAAINAPRFDYDPATLAARGFLIEEQRTNHIRNNTMQGAVAGTPGTLPQVSGSPVWIAQPVGGVALTEVVGTGIENGITYIDLRYTGTTSSTAAGGVLTETITQITAASGQAWTSSFYVRLVGGSTSGITDIFNAIQERDAAGVLLVSTNTTISPTGAALNTQRVATTRTLNNASTARITQQIRLVPASGAAIDITLRIGLPQLEGGLGSSVNSGTASGTTTAVVLSAGSATDDIYNGNSLFVNGEYRVITDYVGSTKTATVSPALSVSPSGSYTVFAVGNAAFATSVIPTSGSALTRAADVASVNTLSPWFNASEGTLYAEFTRGYTGNFSNFATPAIITNNLSGASANNISSASQNGANQQLFNSMVVNNVEQLTYAFENASVNNKVALAYATNNTQQFINGVAKTTDTVCSVPTSLTRLNIGANSSGTTYVNSWLRRVTYYPRRISQAEGIAITA